MKAKKVIAVLLSTLLLLGSVTLFASAETQKKLYVALGDSIAAGTKLFNADVQCYGAIIADTVGWDFENYAVPGHTTDAFFNRLDVEEVKQAVSKADVITVSIGGNNFLLGGMLQMIADGMLKNDYSAMDTIIEDFYISFDKCIKRIKLLNPDVELFVQTLYNPMPGKLGEAYEQGQQRLNNAYKQYLVKNPGAYTLVDIEPLFAGHHEYIATDFIHPNKTGHIVIANAYLKTFHSMGLCEQNTAVEPSLKEIYAFNPIAMIKDMIFQITNAFNLMFSGLNA